MRKLSTIIMFLLLTITAGGFTFQAAENTDDLSNRRVAHGVDCIYGEDEVTCPHFTGRHANCLENGVYKHRNCDLSAPDFTPNTDNTTETPQTTRDTQQNNATLQTIRRGNTAVNDTSGYMHNNRGRMTGRSEGRSHMRRDNSSGMNNNNNMMMQQGQNNNRQSCH